MGKKYIIELLDDCPNEFKGIIVFGLTPEGQIAAEPIPVEDLTPYTAPDLEQVRKEAYDTAYADAEEIYESGKRAMYQKGLKDAWDAVRKIADMPYGEEEKVFGSGGWTFIVKHTASEAIEKIRQYEQEKEEQIQVGDEVKNTQTDARFIVTHMWENNHGEKGVSGFNYECSAFSTALDLVRKTGRHFPEIAEVLQKMKES